MSTSDQEERRERYATSSVTRSQGEMNDRSNLNTAWTEGITQAVPGRKDVRAEATPRRAHIALTTAHRTIVAVDVAGFGEYSRNNTNQARVRHGLYGAMEYAFDTAGISWSTCRREDRGDGVLILVPADTPKVLFAERLPDALDGALSRHNGSHPVEERIRLRLALHAGEVIFDEHGVTSWSIVHTFRLLDSQALRNALAASSGDLAIISSAWFFDEVIRHSEHSRAESYRSTEVANKETNTRAWVRVFGEPILVPRQRDRAPNSGKGNRSKRPPRRRKGRSL